MESRMRVLIADGALVIRRLLSEVLAEEPGFEVIGAAGTGRQAIAKMISFDPDVVLLDVDLPDMDGLEALPEMLQVAHPPAVIMTCSRTSHGTATTLTALSLGAADFVTKPRGVGHISRAIDAVRGDIIPVVRESGLRRKRRRQLKPPGATSGPHPTAGHSVPSDNSIPIVPQQSTGAVSTRIVAIGPSTGGPNVLQTVIGSLPADLAASVVIVQHMPSGFTRTLAAQLDAASPLRVREASGRDELAVGSVWVAPGDAHVVVEVRDDVPALLTSDAPPENSCRPSVDVLFRSVARSFGPRAMGVLLTGTGSDGCAGSRQIREAGGSVIVQDEASSVVWDMPGCVAQEDLAHSVLPIERISSEITRFVQSSPEAWEAGATVPAPAIAAP